MRMPLPSTPEGVSALRASVGADAGSDRAENKVIDGPGGELRLRIIRPDGPVRAVFLNVHGGGWTIGAPEQDDAYNERTALATGVATVSPDYRLAPEHTLANQVADVNAALAWIARVGNEEFGTERILIGGASAGSHLASLAVLHARDELGIIERVAGASLLYGAYDISASIAERLTTPQTFGLTAEFIRATRQAIGSGDPEIWRNPKFSPIYADHSNLPPALFTVGDIDPLLDDSRFLAAQWKAAGNEARLDIWADGPHGFPNLISEFSEPVEARINAWIDSVLAS
ncbi:alpha/beta hydrolase [Streptomyces sp. NPDC057137]|uniref:alpha/beta hydrolase n=1 Tax=Streptomyces sp. NPDC057137 TaxID=3346030 RepID=UPI0036415827